MPCLVLPEVTTSAWQDLPDGHAVGRPIFAIGDTHGCALQLEAVHDRARHTIAESNLSGVLVIRLGDYIDRGPDSLGTLDLVSSGLRLPPVEEVNLMGNHEQLLLNTLFSSDRATAHNSARTWLQVGGLKLCHSLGLPSEIVDPQHLHTLRPLLKEALGRERIELLLSLRTSVQSSGGLVFIHAGLNPRIDPQQFMGQTWRDYDAHDENRSPYWIRDEFLHWREPLHSGLLVVHGHTIEEDAPVVLHHRIGLDAGCVRSGRLLMAEFRGSRFRVHATVPLPDRSRPMEPARLPSSFS